VRRDENHQSPDSAAGTAERGRRARPEPSREQRRADDAGEIAGERRRGDQAENRIGQPIRGEGRVRAQIGQGKPEYKSAHSELDGHYRRPGHADAHGGSVRADYHTHSLGRRNSRC